MNDVAPFEARRILVAIDASPASLDALAAAGALARRLGAGLEGLFVEDEDLLRLAALPFADLVRTPGGERTRLDPAAAETALRALAAQAREALERTAARHRLACAFRVVRGAVAREILAASVGADLTVLGTASHARLARSALGATARATAARATSSVLLLPRGASVDGGVLALDDGTPAGARAHAAARRLSPEERPPASISWTGRGPLPPFDAIAHLSPWLVALPAEAALATGELVERLLAAGIAVLLVR